MSKDLNDDEVAQLFGDIVESSFPRSEIDAHIITDVYLISGQILRLHGLDPIVLAEVLEEYGRAEMHDADGRMVVIFLQGVATILGVPE